MTLLKDITLCAFDIETSGAHPLSSEICELAGVKWKNGEIIGEFQSLIKPTHLMSDFIISIHGITNEMVANAPRIEDKIEEFHSFIQGTHCVGHHSPFDIGFISIEFEKLKLPPPPTPAFCSSLIARYMFPESVNHKLQTLIPFLGIPQNTAHRAFDDAVSCLEVTKKCIDKFGWEKTTDDLYKIQGKRILWSQFYIGEVLRNPVYKILADAIKQKRSAQIVFRHYNKSKQEVIAPVGLVRNPDGDYIFAHSTEEKRVKRYYLNKITESELI